MKVGELLEKWGRTATEQRTVDFYSVKLPLHDAARVRALAEMFPGKSETDIITELLSSALDELEGSLPYRQGDKVIAEDDFGDPIFEDAGLTPRFKELALLVSAVPRGCADR